MRFRFSKLLVALVFFLIGGLILVSQLQAQECVENACSQGDQDCLSRAITACQNKLKETGAQKATLEQAIAILNGEIALQQLQINQTQWEISGLEGEINELSQRIEGLGYSLDRLGTVLIERVRTQYKQSRSAPALRLLGIESLSDLVTQMKYLVLAQRQTADTMERTETQRLEYDEQKQIKEQKQQELEAKRNKLLTQRQELEQTQAEKRVLLANTQNNERRYQQLLADAQRELRQISQAANVVIREGNGVSVSRGEVIGTMGNTGYSFGAHLHFGVYRHSVSSFTSGWSWYYSNYVNPLDKLKNSSVTWDTGCPNDPSGTTNSGSGSWDWPMSSPRITQSYGGNTCYNYLYGGNVHPALDMVGIGDISVRSVADGEGYFWRNCLGDGGNGVFIFHDDNYMTVYWHLQ